MKDSAIFKIHANFCTVMSNEKRLRIMWLLGSKGEMSVGAITEALGISMANASQHLRIMRDQKAVKTRKEKQTVYYRISNPVFFEGCKMIHQGLMELHMEQSRRFEEEAEQNTQELQLVSSEH